MTGGDVVLLCWMRLLRRAHHIKTHFFFPAGKRNGFWNPKKKGLLRIGALWGVRRRPASLRPHRGPAPAVTAYVGGTGKSRGSVPPPPGRWVSRRGLPGGHGTTSFVGRDDLGAPSQLPLDEGAVRRSRTEGVNRREADFANMGSLRKAFRLPWGPWGSQGRGRRILRPLASE